MTYRVDTAAFSPGAKRKTWHGRKAGLTLSQALKMIDAFGCHRVVRSDGLVVARRDANSRWVMTSYDGRPT